MGVFSGHSVQPPAAYTMHRSVLSTADPASFACESGLDRLHLDGKLGLLLQLIEFLRDAGGFLPRSLWRVDRP